MGRVTYGAVLKAIATGVPLPEGAAVTRDGHPTTDPSQIEADTAGVMPFGDDQAYKGFALALLVETLCRSLAGERGHAAVALLATRSPHPWKRFGPPPATTACPETTLPLVTAPAWRELSSSYPTTSGAGSRLSDMRRDSTRDSPSPAMLTP